MEIYREARSHERRNVTYKEYGKLYQFSLFITSLMMS